MPANPQVQRVLLPMAAGAAPPQTPTNRMCAAIYKLWAPPTNNARPAGPPPPAGAGQWQTMSINFAAARFDATGKLKVKDATVRVILNGNLQYDGIAIPRPTGQRVNQSESQSQLVKLVPAEGTLKKTSGPIQLQEHKNAVMFRDVNISSWRPARWWPKSALNAKVEKVHPNFGPNTNNAFPIDFTCEHLPQLKKENPQFWLTNDDWMKRRRWGSGRWSPPNSGNECPVAGERQGSSNFQSHRRTITAAKGSALENPKSRLRTAPRNLLVRSGFPASNKTPAKSTECLMPRVRFQFRLRTLLLLVAVLSIPCALVRERVSKAARTRITIAEKTPRIIAWYGPEPEAPAFIKQLMGDDFFLYIQGVTLSCERAKDRGGGKPFRALENFCRCSDDDFGKRARLVEYNRNLNDCGDNDFIEGHQCAPAITSLPVHIVELRQSGD